SIIHHPSSIIHHPSSIIHNQVVSTGCRPPMFPIVNAQLSCHHTRAGYQVEISSDLRNALRDF
ncbi:hypothetical protein, partial [Aeromonas dhakensis]|uniref:hypothetical protein n=1 Tax=Aeromonas dhakensis TaxID=196024 RepID=UPI002B46CE72